MQSPPASPEHIVDRADLPRSFLDTVWPLAALALLMLMLLRACVPAAPATAADSAFDAATVAASANQVALAALRNLPPGAPPAEVIAALNLPVLDFETAESEVPAGAGDVLQQAATVIAALPAATRLRITGHTDGVGDAAANRELSQRRAEAVRAFLIEHGAPAEKLLADGAGDTQPVASNSTVLGRFRNRRIEFSAAP